MKDNEAAVWDGETISMVAHYEWPTVHSKTHTARKCYPNDNACHYWIAADGQCYGLIGQDTCIAVIEEMIHSAGVKRSYVTFAGKDKSDAAWKRWQNKWSKRTAEVCEFENTVRG